MVGEAAGVAELVTTSLPSSIGPATRTRSAGKMKRQMRDEHLNAVGVSNATNSRSPDDLKSRIFIGNLNTSLVTKRHLHVLFASYGDVKAISMHKGYAFIQYGDEMDALNAVFAQDGQLLSGQAIDVNLVLEPKPRQRSCKKVLNEETSSDKSHLSEDGLKKDDGSEDSEIDAGATPSQGTSSLVAEDEKMNLMKGSAALAMSIQTNLTDTSIETPSSQEAQKQMYFGSESSIGSEKDFRMDDDCPDVPSCDQQGSGTSDHRKSDEPTASKRQRIDCGTSLVHMQPQFDVLICGNCRTLFTSLPSFLQHKKMTRCRLRFVCHCGQPAPSGHCPPTADRLT